MFTKLEKKFLLIIFLLSATIFSMLIGTSSYMLEEGSIWLLMAGILIVVSMISLGISLSWFQKVNSNNRLILKDD